MTSEPKKQNLNSLAYQLIKELIISGELKPGEKLKETNLSERLNISRTPVRDAIRRLEQDNLVRIYPSQSTEVTRLSRTTITELYECQAVLEGLVAKSAAKHITEDDLNLIEESIYLSKRYFSNGELEKTVEKNTIFHDKLLESCNNQSLIQMMGNIRTQILRYRVLTSFVGFQPNFIEEHLAIYHAVAEKKADEAEILMKKHVLHDLENFLQKLENSPYFDQ